MGKEEKREGYNPPPQEPSSLERPTPPPPPILRNLKSVEYTLREQLVEEILRDLEGIIQPRVDWSEDTSQMAEEALQNNQKTAKAIKGKILREIGKE